MGNAEDPFERAFQEVEAHWGEDKAHRRFIAFCAAQGALGEAGRRYRAVREQDPARSEAAARWIDAVLAAALQNLGPLRSAPRAPGKRLTWAVMGVCVCLALYAILSVLRARSH